MADFKNMLKVAQILSENKILDTRTVIAMTKDSLIEDETIQNNKANMWYIFMKEMFYKNKHLFKNLGY